MSKTSADTGFFTEPLSSRDPELFGSITAELGRQRHEIELIASENIVSRAVMEAQGSVMTNKYAEGYPGKRYYGGCQFVDVAENLAIERACKLFNCSFANVQANSGSQANQGVFNALLKPGDTILGMSLDAGGHLTHGAAPNQSGKWFHAVQYGVRKDTHRIDLDEVRDLARKETPRLLFAGGTAVPRTIEFAAYAEIAREVGAIFVADIAHISGLVAAGVHPSPVPHADVVSTTTHKTLRGPRGGMLMCKETHAKAIDRAVFPGLQGGPHNHTTAALAVALREAATQEFQKYAVQIVANAKALAAAMNDRGFSLITGGTDPTHFLEVDAVDADAAVASLRCHAEYLAALPFHPLPSDFLPPMFEGAGRVAGVPMAVLFRVVQLG